MAFSDQMGQILNENRLCSICVTGISDFKCEVLKNQKKIAIWRCGAEI